MINRRSMFLISGAAALTAGSFGVRADVGDVRGSMVDVARRYLHSTDWEPETNLAGQEKSYYCNIFVAEVAREAGGATWKKIPRPIAIYPDRDPVASEWADPKFEIDGWDVVFDPASVTDDMSPNDIFKKRMPGDIISGGGHIAIMSDNATSESKLVISASAKTGAVEENDWSFRLPNSDGLSATEYDKKARQAASRFTVRRFVGV